MNSSTGNSPDIDPVNNETLAGSIRFAFRKLMQNVNGMLPAKVISYDRTTNRVQVQLMIAVVTTQGAQISRPQLASIPVLLLGGGGYFLSFPLKEGDLGWVVANDRDISLFLQNYSETAPNTGRIKSFSDGVFIPSVMTDYTIGGDDADNAVLQSTDGTVKITLGTGKITISAPLVEIDGYNPSLIIPPGGTLAVIGDITATGDITPFV
jgi:hypothetical protein